MKHAFRRALALILSLAALTTAASAAVLRETELTLARGFDMTGAYLDTADGPAREQILTLQSGAAVGPMVVYGDTLYGRSTMDYIQEYLAKKDLTAVGAVNAAFFDMSTGIPYGLVVTEGILRSSGNVPSIGWGGQSQALVMGVPNLEVTMSYSGGSAVLEYNKALSKVNGFCLYSRDYDFKTKHSLKAYNLILDADTAQLSVEGEVTAKVKAIVPDASSVDIPENGFVLSLALDTQYQTALETIKSFRKGDRLTIHTSIDPAWRNVTNAVGGGELLVEDGEALSGFTLDTADKQAARTAIGVRKNGDVICYTVDRDKHSKGMALPQLAARMAELGCETALNLDGGGSTALGARLPGYDTFSTINKPSDGKQRPCANFLFFVTPTARAGEAARLHVYPYDRAVLPGGSLTMEVKASDRTYRAARVPGDVTFDAVGGAMDGSVFIGGQPGEATVTASANGLTGSARVLVVETPDTLDVLREGQRKSLAKLLAETGSTTDLTAAATYLGANLAAQDSSFTWEVSPELGEIDENGVFTAADTETKGDLVLSCGSRVLHLPVEVRSVPFTDLDGHWARPYIAQMYFHEVLNGSKNANGDSVYRPDASMTRQEFMAAMIRWLGVDTSSYQDKKLPFDDKDKIADWAMDAMKTAYALGYLTGSQKGGKLYAEPTAVIDRETAMTLLARTRNAVSDSDALTDFPDSGKVSDWAKPSLTAMVEQGVINGQNGQLAPQGPVSRAMVAKLLYAME